MHPTYSSQFQKDGISHSDSLLLSKKSLLRLQIEHDFQLKSHPSSKAELYAVIQKAIVDANPRREGTVDSEVVHLSHELVRVSSCYGVDPVVYTGLIWRESNFKQAAVSGRKAVGITQMTSAGIQEVLERLSPISHKRLGYLRSLVKKCNPNFMDRVPYEVSADTIGAWRNTVVFSRTDALVMGALLLKINLARAPAHLQSNQIETYRVALEHYNGDRSIKIQFAQDVLMLAKRMIALPEVAFNDSKFLSQIRGL